MDNQDGYPNKTYSLRGDMAGSRASKGLKPQPLGDKETPVDGVETKGMSPGDPVIREDEERPLVTEPVNSVVSLDTRPRENGFPIRKVRFHKRLEFDVPYVKFSIYYKHLPRDFTLYDGEVYDLPEDVIVHLQAIKQRDVVTLDNGYRQPVERNFFYFEFLD